MVRELFCLPFILAVPFLRHRSRLEEQATSATVVEEAETDGAPSPSLSSEQGGAGGVDKLHQLAGGLMRGRASRMDAEDSPDPGAADSRLQVTDCRCRCGGSASLYHLVPLTSSWGRRSICLVALSYPSLPAGGCISAASV